MDKVKSRPVMAAIRVLSAALTLSILAFTPLSAQAQNSLQATQIVIGAPAQSNAGQTLTVQAVLADSQGHPISKAVVYFTTQTSFLGRKGDVVLAQAVTDEKGQAVAEFADDFSGAFNLNAEFRGDTQYAPSNATAQVTTAEDGQVYIEHVGVDIPGFNVPPVSPRMVYVDSPRPNVWRFIQNLWPAMNGWPVAAVLILVWSMYLVAVRFVWRVAALGSKPEELPPYDSRRPL